MNAFNVVLKKKEVKWNYFTWFMDFENKFINLR